MASVTLRDKVLARIREERERCDRAERPPWVYMPNTGLVYVTGQLAGREQLLSVVASNEYFDKNDPDDSHGNGEFIASARTLLPALLSEAESQVIAHHPFPVTNVTFSHRCPGCRDFLKSAEECSVILGWARVFGIGEADDAK